MINFGINLNHYNMKRFLQKRVLYAFFIFTSLITFDAIAQNIFSGVIGNLIIIE